MSGCRPGAPVNVLLAASNLEGRDEEVNTAKAGNKFISRSRTMQVVAILSVRVLHTLAQKLGAGVSSSLQSKPEVAV
jgi:hypothetical protein